MEKVGGSVFAETWGNSLTKKLAYYCLQTLRHR